MRLRNPTATARLWLHGTMVFCLSRLFVLCGAALVAVFKTKSDPVLKLLEATPTKGTYEVLNGWDWHWYRRIVEQGYPRSIPANVTYYQDEARAAFFPLFPMLGKVADAILPKGASAANLAVALLESRRTAEGAALLTAALGATAPAERLALGLTDAQAVGLEGWMAALAGRREEARGALRRLDALEPVSDLPPYSVIVRAALGERAAAVAALRERLRTGLVYGRDLHVHVGLDALRGDPGYVALASEFGLPVGSARAPAETGAAPG